MPGIKKRSRIASNQLRDEDGNFVSKDAPKKVKVGGDGTTPLEWITI